MSRRGVHPVWLAVAALVILSFGGLLYSSDATRRLLVDDVQEAQAAAAEAQVMVVELRRHLDLNARQADLVVSILTAADMPGAMSGKENATASAARAYWSPTRGLLIVADNLPVPPPGRIYQVWVIGGGMPMSAGLLGEQGSGRGMLIAPPTGWRRARDRHGRGDRRAAGGRSCADRIHPVGWFVIGIPVRGTFIAMEDFNAETGRHSPFGLKRRPSPRRMNRGR